LALFSLFTSVFLSFLAVSQVLQPNLQLWQLAQPVSNQKMVQKAVFSRQLKGLVVVVLRTPLATTTKQKIYMTYYRKA
jgi:hypothetical protein